MLAFFRVAMRFIEKVGVGHERAETGFGAEVDRPAAILKARKIGRVRVAKFSATQGDEARILLFLQRLFRHLNDQTNPAAENDDWVGNSSNFCDENFKGIDGQATRGLGGLQSFGTRKQDL